MAGYPEKSVSNISSIRGGKVFSVKLGDLNVKSYRHIIQPLRCITQGLGMLLRRT